MSAVRQPLSRTLETAASMQSASSGISKEKRSIMAAAKIVPMGFAMSLPAISGAEP